MIIPDDDALIIGSLRCVMPIHLQDTPFSDELMIYVSTHWGTHIIAFKCASYLWDDDVIGTDPAIESLIPAIQIIGPDSMKAIPTLLE